MRAKGSRQVLLLFVVCCDLVDRELWNDGRYAAEFEDRLLIATESNHSSIEFVPEVLFEACCE